MVMISEPVCQPLACGRGVIFQWCVTVFGGWGSCVSEAPVTLSFPF